MTIGWHKILDLGWTVQPSSQSGEQQVSVGFILYAGKCCIVFPDDEVFKLLFSQMEFGSYESVYLNRILFRRNFLYVYMRLAVWWCSEVYDKYT
jgi:hypothetical protein